MIPHLCLCSLCFLQSCNKSLIFINQACSGLYWENMGPRSFFYGPHCARSVRSRPRADILLVRPSRLVDKTYASWFKTNDTVKHLSGQGINSTSPPPLSSNVPTSLFPSQQKQYTTDYFTDSFWWNINPLPEIARLRGIILNGACMNSKWIERNRCHTFFSTACILTKQAVSVFVHL